MPENSPLAEAETTSLDEYFGRKPPFDPGTINAIKVEYRRMREKWLAAEAAGEKPKSTRAKKPAAPQAKVGDLWSDE